MTYYDDIAEGYDELHKEEQVKKIKIIKENMGSVGESLLDVGCGTGFSLNYFDAERKIGIDPSKELLKKCKYEHVVASAENIPFPDNSFDTVISITAVQNFDNIEKGLKELKRVAKKQVIISALRKSPKIKKIDALISSIFKVLKKVDEEKDIIYFCKP